MYCSKLVVLSVMGLGFVFGGLGARVYGQEPGMQPPAAVAPAKPEAPDAATHGRLPAHFAELVDDGQRQRIYAVQQEYAERIAKLKAELEAVVDERDAKVRAILTPDQQKRLGELEAAAKASAQAKRKARRAAARANPSLN